MGIIVNIALIAITLIAILMVGWVKFDLFPLISCPFSSIHAYNINEVIYTICTGVIVSSLFYLIVVYLPAQMNERKIKKIIQFELADIGYRLQRGMAYFCQKYDWKNDGYKIKGLTYEKYFSLIQKQKLDRKVLMDFCYKSGNSIYSKGLYFNLPETEYFVNEKKFICSYIEKIVSHPGIQFGNFELINCLYELKNCNFYHYIESATQDPDSEFCGCCVNNDFSKALFEYYKIYLKIIKFCELGTFEICKL